MPTPISSNEAGLGLRARLSQDESSAPPPSRNDWDEESLFIVEIDDVDLVDSALAEAALRRLCCAPWSQRPRPNRMEMECIQLASCGSVKRHTMARRFHHGDSLSRRLLHELRQDRHFGSDLRSIGHALSSAGPAGLRRGLLETSVRRALYCSAAPKGALWPMFRHVIAVSVIARALARDFRLEPDEIADAALFHDAGIMIALRYVLEDRDVIDFKDPEELVFGVASVRGELTIQCAENWRLGDTAHTILCDLQRPRSATDLHPGVALVVLAEELALRLGYGAKSIDGVSPHDEPSATTLGWARQALGIGASMTEVERIAQASLQRVVNMS